MKYSGYGNSLPESRYTYDGFDRMTVSAYYFRKVMNDKDLDLSLRMESSAVYFLLSGMTPMIGYIKFKRLNNVYRDGINKYHNKRFNDSDYKDDKG